MTDTRFANLLNLMEQHQIKALALNPGAVFAYLTGLSFHLMERPTVLLITKNKEPILFLPELEVGKVAASRIPLTTIPFNDDPATWQKVFTDGLKRLNLEGETIGIEPTRLRFLEMDYLQKAILAAKFVAADGICGDLRVKKDSGEVNEMKRAVKIAQDALIAVIPSIKPGVDEKEIAAELTIQMLRLGTDPELPFSPIIASGPNSANPHAVPTGRKIQNGDLIVIDWGARSNGYCSDLTRTFAVGSLSPELKKVYEVVRMANAAGRAAGAPEQTAGSVDKAARDVIEAAGFGLYFTHRTGHGLGLEDHETPYIYASNPQILSPGMTYTVEPGIYLPGVGGVRIEDNMVVLPSGSESLSDFPRELTIL